MCLARKSQNTALLLIDALRTPSLVAEAPTLRIPALIQLRRLEEAQAEARRAVSEWLAPPTTQYSINQVVSRQQLLTALVDLPAAEDLRSKVGAAPQPEIFVPEGDFM
jgi:hypothetical protein